MTLMIVHISLFFLLVDPLKNLDYLLSPCTFPRSTPLKHSNQPNTRVEVRAQQECAWHRFNSLICLVLLVTKSYFASTLLGQK